MRNSLLLALFLALVIGANAAGASPSVEDVSPPEHDLLHPAAEQYVFYRSWGGEGNLLYAYGIAVGQEGKIYVANTDLNRITIISPGERTYTNWGEAGSQAGEFDWPTDIAVDGDENIFVVDQRNNRIQKFDAGGNFLLEWNNADGEGLSWPGGIGLDGIGHVYVADTFNSRILKFDEYGNFLVGWGAQGSGAGEFDQPRDVAIGPDGNIYVSDTVNHRIQKFRDDGTYITQWGGQGSQTGEFTRPTGIAIAENGIVYVADSGNGRIQLFDTNGQFLGEWSNRVDPVYLLDPPIGLALDNEGSVYVTAPGTQSVHKFRSDGRHLVSWKSENGATPFMTPDDVEVVGDGTVYVADYFRSRILRFTNEGSLLSAWGTYGTGLGQYGAPNDISLAQDGTLFVADRNNDRIQRVTNNGTPIYSWGVTGTDPGEFAYPEGIALDQEGTVFVADTYNHRVQRFTLGGAFLSEWGSAGNAADSFNHPTSIVVDSLGHVYVSDSGNYRIQVFDKNGNLLYGWGSIGSGNGQFRVPSGLALDSSERVFVVDTWNDRIQLFTRDGFHLTHWGSKGSGPGEFDLPRGIAVDEMGVVYVADRMNHRVQVFSPLGLVPAPTSNLSIHNSSFTANPALSYWTYGGSLAVARVAGTVLGDYSARLAEPLPQVEQGQGEAWLHQTFYVDPAWARPMLSFRYNMHVNDILHYSDFFVAIQDGVGLNHLATVLRAGYVPCSGNYAPPAGTDLGWRYHQYDLSQFKGQHVRLVFSNRNLWPDSLGIWTYVDDVRVVDAGPLPGDSHVFLPALFDNANGGQQQCDPLTNAHPWWESPPLLRSELP